MGKKKEPPLEDFTVINHLAITSLSKLTRSPEEKRTYLLEDEIVPPKGYDKFLLDVHENIVDFILEENNCSSLSELEEKERERISKLNPGKTPEEIKHRYGLEISRYGFIPYALNPRNSNIEFGKEKEGFQKFVEEISKLADKKFPNRKGKFPNKTPLLDENSFRFGVEFFSLTESWLEIDVDLIDWGWSEISTSGREFKAYFNPAIQIKSYLGTGFRTVPRRVAERLEKVVLEYYNVDEITYSSSYTKQIK